uniref:Defensin n=1 Tax=Aeshna cyanea TaxID=12921 RepID=DEFI_AESCY|nr:RecName: Full=Defensin [Aeshna cyanea]AAB24032.1 defensin [Aeschna cyanea=dragonflies, Peptide, 38 aa] [Aeshna cyanea]
GFGCPLDQMQCHRHCQTITGRSGGYCSGPLKLTCTCYR